MSSGTLLKSEPLPFPPRGAITEGTEAAVFDSNDKNKDTDTDEDSNNDPSSSMLLSSPSRPYTQEESAPSPVPNSNDKKISNDNGNASVLVASNGNTTTDEENKFNFLLKCSALELSDYLVRNRFKHSGVATQKFLQAAANAAVAGPQPSPADGNNDDDHSQVRTDNHDDNLGPQLTKAIEASMLTNRIGKFQITLHKQGLVGYKTNSPSIRFVIPRGMATNLVLFPRPEDCRSVLSPSKRNANKKPDPASILLICLKSSVPLESTNKELQQICLSCPWDKVKGPIGPTLLRDDDDDDGCESGTSTSTSDDESGVNKGNYSSPLDPMDAWCRVLMKSLGCNKSQVSRITPGKSTEGKSYRFVSHRDNVTSTTSAAMPFVRCYHGLNDGVLYPTKEGLLFYKPPYFIPRYRMHSISCQRAGGSKHATRYIDLILEIDPVKKDDTDPSDTGKVLVEFSNIEREEEDALGHYIHDILVPAMHNDVSASGDKEAASSRKEKSTDGTGDNRTPTNDKENDSEDDEDASDEDYEEDERASDDGRVVDEEESSDEQSDSDESGGVPVVEDGYALELAKQAKNNNMSVSSTESEGENSDSDSRSRKKKRRRRC